MDIRADSFKNSSPGKRKHLKGKKGKIDIHANKTLPSKEFYLDEGCPI